MSDAWSMNDKSCLVFKIERYWLTGDFLLFSRFINIVAKHDTPSTKLVSFKTVKRYCLLALLQLLLKEVSNFLKTSFCVTSSLLLWKLVLIQKKYTKKFLSKSYDLQTFPFHCILWKRSSLEIVLNNSQWMTQRTTLYSSSFSCSLHLIPASFFILLLLFTPTVRPVTLFAACFSRQSSLK